MIEIYKNEVVTSKYSGRLHRVSGMLEMISEFLIPFVAIAPTELGEQDHCSSWFDFLFSCFFRSPHFWSLHNSDMDPTSICPLTIPAICMQQSCKNHSICLLSKPELVLHILSVIVQAIIKIRFGKRDRSEKQRREKNSTFPDHKSYTRFLIYIDDCDDLYWLSSCEIQI